MAVIFVSGHEGAHRLARIAVRNGKLPFKIDKHFTHIEAGDLKSGDMVIGNLPLRMLATFKERGIGYLSIDMEAQPEERGHDLGATHMAARSAALREYSVEVGSRVHHLGPQSPSSPAQTARGAITVMLVSRELAPQLIGISMRPTPTALLVVTSSMQETADILERVLLQRRKVKTSRKSFDADARTSIRPMRAFAQDCLQDLINQGYGPIYVNVTGGKKPMSIAFTLAAREVALTGGDVSIYYVDSEDKWLDDGINGEPMRPVLSIADALACQGLQPEREGAHRGGYEREAGRTELFSLLLALDEYRLGMLNEHFDAMRAHVEAVLSPRYKVAKLQAELLALQWCPSTLPVQVAVKPAPQKFVEVKALLDSIGPLLQLAKVLKCAPEFMMDEGVIQLTFLGKPKRVLQELNFLCGGWIESWIGQVLCNAGLDDWTVSLKLKLPNKANTENEIDGIGICGNQLLFIEAKTNNQGRWVAGRRSDVAESALYKADSIGTRLARYFGEKWYVSARPLDPADLERAKQLRITVFAPGPKSSLLSDLPKALQTWQSRVTLGAIDASYQPTFPK